MNFAVAPCSWGIEDPYNKENPTWETVLQEAGSSGFSGLELGPYGYLPTDPKQLKDALASRNLTLIAGTLYDDLTGTASLVELKEKTRNICRLLSKAADDGRCKFLVIIDDVKEKRNRTAGHPELAFRLDPYQWNQMIGNLKILSRIAWEEFEIRPVVHPHAGGFIEFSDEIENFLNDVDSAVAGLCLDTGHLYYAGSDPSLALKKYSSRLDYVHFKDISNEVYIEALKNRMGFFEACNQGVMCSIGSGCVNYDAIFQALKEIGYSGWITVEQERDPRKSEGTLKDLQKSFKYLQEVVGKESPLPIVKAGYK